MSIEKSATVALTAYPPELDGADAVLALLRTWSWRRPGIDPYLQLGWIADALLGDAGIWRRPLAWVTGGHGTGKLTLQVMINWLVGYDLTILSATSSVAGVCSALKHSPAPVCIEEDDFIGSTSSIHKMVELARAAATDSLVIRGSSDHNVAHFMFCSSFIFLSTLKPPLLAQDVSRIASLELDKLAPGGNPPDLTLQKVLALGRQIREHLIEQFPRASATFEAYRAQLAEVGHTARGQDLYGALLAAADLALHDRLPDSERLSGWRERMATLAMPETDIDGGKRCSKPGTEGAL